jgi:hypothetical protein
MAPAKEKDLSEGADVAGIENINLTKGFKFSYHP